MLPQRGVPMDQLPPIRCRRTLAELAVLAPYAWGFDCYQLDDTAAASSVTASNTSAAGAASAVSDAGASSAAGDASNTSNTTASSAQTVDDAIDPVIIFRFRADDDEALDALATPFAPVSDDITIDPERLTFPLPYDENRLTREEFARCSERTRHTLVRRQIIQRTPAWMRFREIPGLLTGSTIASAAHKNDKQSSRQFFDTMVGKRKPFVGNQFTEWGTKNEPGAIRQVEQRIGERVLAVGLIWVTGTFFAFSLDGITESGVTVEVKCPWSRPFPDKIPKHYRPQVWMGMWGTGAPESHYLEYHAPGGKYPREDARMYVATEKHSFFRDNMALFIKFYDDIHTYIAATPQWTDDKRRLRQQEEQKRAAYLDALAERTQQRIGTIPTYAPMRLRDEDREELGPAPARTAYVHADYEPISTTTTATYLVHVGAVERAQSGTQGATQSTADSSYSTYTYTYSGRRKNIDHVVLAVESSAHPAPQPSAQPTGQAISETTPTAAFDSMMTEYRFSRRVTPSLKRSRIVLQDDDV
jgi:hypothetical protein